MKYKEENGTVTEIKGDTAVVEVHPGPDVDCSGCCACSGGPDERYVEVPRGELEEGDDVRLRIPTFSGYVSMILLFGLPMALFITGMIAGTYLQGSEGANGMLPLVGGGVGLALSFVVVWAANRLMLRRAPVEVDLLQPAKG
jgi:positive regulator of sigma E activity